jgi:hypothetical protein
LRRGRVVGIEVCELRVWNGFCRLKSRVVDEPPVGQQSILIQCNESR